MSIELTSESTHEDITQAVDDIIQSRQGEASKSDAQQIAEERDEPVVAETESSDDTGGEEEQSGAQAWLDDDLKAELAVYGIDETGLADFANREEVERALRLFDKTALETGRKALADGEAKPRDEQGRFQKQEAAAPKEGQYEIGLSKDVYDDDLVDELTRMRDHYESRLGVLEQRLAEQDAKADEQLFDSLVDAIGHADLFGTTGKENAKQLQRRQDLHVAVKAQQIGLQVLGKQAPLDQTLVQRVARMVFAEDLSKKELKAQTRKIAQQSNGRMGGGQTRPSDPPETLRDEFRRRYKELEGAG